MSYFYISNPYNGTDEQRQNRFEVAAKVCGLLIKKDVHAWSPIVHNHAMMKIFDDFTLEERRTKILEFDFSLLNASKGMIVLTIEGWKESFGVSKEIELCEERNLPIFYLDPEDLNKDLELDKILKDQP